MNFKEILERKLNKKNLVKRGCTGFGTPSSFMNNNISVNAFIDLHNRNLNLLKSK